MYNPFSTKNQPDKTDELLIAASLEGDKSSLEELIQRHESWIYNICVRMVGNTADAADLTQEILIKVVTSLATFQHKSSFRTWLYRIVKNDVINWGKKKARFRVNTFTELAHALDNAQDIEITASDSFAADNDTLINETKFRCMTGMLLCLDKTQRLIFILGELFEVSDTVGSEIMEISKVNFRVLLSRAKEQLYSFMNEKCGLENKNNPCRCARKTKAFIAEGFVDPKKLLFAIGHKLAIEEVVESRQGEMEQLLSEKYQALYQKHPFLSSSGMADFLKEVLSSEQVVKTFNFKSNNN